MKEYLTTELNKLKEMNFKEKRQYIWEYYKLHMFFIAIISFIVGSLLNVWVFNPPRQDYLYIAWISPHVHHELLNELGEKLEVIVDDNERQRVSIVSYAQSDNPQERVAIHTRFMANMTLGIIDLFITPRGGIDEMAFEGFIRPINPILEMAAEINPTLYNELKQRTLTITYTQNIEDAPTLTDKMAFSIEGSPLLEYIGINSEKLYVSLVITTDSIYEIIKGLEVLFK